LIHQLQCGVFWRLKCTYKQSGLINDWVNSSSFWAGCPRWVHCAPEPQRLCGHSAVTLPPTGNSTATATALVCGGCLTGQLTGCQSACYTYSSTTDVWTNASTMNTQRALHGSTVYKSRAKKGATFKGVTLNRWRVRVRRIQSSNRYNFGIDWNAERTRLAPTTRGHV
jgi:hypothetical protein